MRSLYYNVIKYFFFVFFRILPVYARYSTTLSKYYVFVSWFCDIFSFLSLLSFVTSLDRNWCIYYFLSIYVLTTLCRVCSRLAPFSLFFYFHLTVNNVHVLVFFFCYNIGHYQAMTDIAPQITPLSNHPNPTPSSLPTGTCSVS